MQIPKQVHRDRYGREIKDYDDPAGCALPKQVALPFYGRTIDVDGYVDEGRPGIQYIGKASHVFDSTYRCLAIVSGVLCAVEVTIRPHDQTVFPSELPRPI